MQRYKHFRAFFPVALALFILGAVPSLAEDHNDATNYNSYRTLKNDGPGTGAGALATSACALPGVSGADGNKLAKDGPTLIQQTCLQCHSNFSKNGFTMNGKFFDNAAILSAVTSGSMPKGKTLSIDQRQSLLTALSN